MSQKIVELCESVAVEMTKKQVDEGGLPQIDTDTERQKSISKERISKTQIV